MADVLTLGQIGRQTEQAQFEETLSDVDASVIANTQVDNGIMRNISKTTLGNVLPTIAYTQDALGFEDAANETMLTAAERFGIGADLSVEKEGGDFAELAKYVIPSSAGVGLFKGGVSLATKALGKEATSKFVMKKSLQAKLGLASGELATQNALLTGGDVIQSKFGDKGTLENKTGTRADYWKMYGMNLMGDAALTSMFTSAAFTVHNQLKNMKKKRSFTGKNYSEYNLDKDANMAVNSVILKNTGDTFEPTYNKSEVQTPDDFPLGQTYDDMLNSGNFTGVISDGKGRYARKDSDGNIQAGIEAQSKKDPTQDVIKFPEDKARNVDGMLTLDTFNNLLNTSFKSLDEIDVKSPYSVIDKEGNFRVKTPAQGDLTGARYGNAMFLDLSKSKLDEGLYSMTYNNKQVVRGIDSDAAKLVKIFGKMKKEDSARFFNDLTAQLDSKGNLEINQALKGSIERRFGTEAAEAYIFNSEGLAIAKKAGAQSFEGAEAVNLDRQLNAFAQVLLAKSLTGDLAGSDLGKLRAYTEYFDGKLSSVLDSQLTGFDIKDPQLASNTAVDKLYNVTTNSDGTRTVNGLKPEFKKALDVSYALNIAKMGDDANMIEPGSMATGIINGAMDLLGVTSEPIHIEGIKVDLKARLQNSGIFETLTDGINQMSIEGGKVVTKQGVQGNLVQVLKEFGETPMDRQRAIANILGHGASAEKYGWNVKGPGRVKNKYMIPDDMDPVANGVETLMRTTRFDIDPDGHALIDQWLAWAEAPMGTENKLTMSDINIGQFTGALTPINTKKVITKNGKKVSNPEYHGNWNPTAKETLRARIDKFRKEVQELDRIRGAVNDDIGIYFDVERDLNTRSRYMGLVNPQSSKLFLTAFHTQDRFMKLIDGSGRITDDFTNNADGTTSSVNKNVEFAYRTTLANFGVKVEGIRDFSVILNEWNKLTNVILDQTGNIRQRYTPQGRPSDTLIMSRLINDIDKAGLDFEKNISPATLKQVSDIEKSVKGNQDVPIKLYAEVDAKLSGVANLMAILGYTDKRVGLGGMIDTSIPDIYTQLADKLGISRAEAKPSVVGDNYLASPWTSSLVFADFVIANMLKGQEINSKVSGIYEYMGEVNKAISSNIIKKKDLIEIQRTLKNAEDSGKELSTSDLLDTYNLSTQARYHMGKLIDWEHNNKSFMGSDIFEALWAQDAINNGRKVTDEGLEALRTIFAKSMLNEITVALDSLYKQDFPGIIDFRKDMSTFTTQMSEVFAHKFLNRNMSEQVAIKKIQSILNDLGTPEAKVAAKSEVRIRDILLRSTSDLANDGGSGNLSIKNIVNGIAAENLLSSGIYGTKVIRDIIPVVDIGNGKKVPMMSVEGFAGYQNNANYRTVSPISVFQPIFMIAHDALIMGDALSTDIVNMSDAGIGAKSLLDFEARANQSLGGLIADNNPYKIMAEAFDQNVKDFDFYNNPDTTKIAHQWLGEQRAMKNGNKPIGDAVTNEITKIEKTTVTDLEKRGDFRKPLDSKADGVNTRKNENYNDGTVINNYSIGMESNKITLGDRLKVDHSGTPEHKTYPNADDYTYTMIAMENIDYKDAPDIGHIHDKTSGGVIATENISVKFGAEQSKWYTNEDMNGNIVHNIEIAYDKPSFEALKNLIHELSHSHIENNPHLIKELQSNIMDLVYNDRLTYEDGSAIWGEMDPSLVASGEPLTNLMHILYTNEQLMSNINTYAKSFGESNLAQYVKPLLIDNATIYTIKDLSKYLDEQGALTSKSQLNAMATDVSGAMNGDLNVRAFFNKIERDNFSTVLKESNAIVLNARAAVVVANEKLGVIGFTDLFTLDPQKDAMELMLSMKKGGDQSLQGMAVAINEQLLKLTDFEGSRNYDKEIGNLALNGVNKFMNEFSQAGDSKQFRELVDSAQRPERSWAKNLAHTRQTLYEKLDKRIKGLAFGKDAKYTAQTLADKYLKELYPLDNAKVQSNRIRMKNFIVREAAYKRIRKNDNAIGTAFASIKNPEMKKNAVTLLNMLETRFTNSDTLFNTNAHYDLAANNRRAVAMLESNFDGNKGNIIGRQNINGNKYVIVAKKDSSYVVGTQDTQVMSFDVTGDAKGIYRLEVDNTQVVVSPENIVNKNEYVDTSITQMLSKNAYMQQYNDIGTDIAFRQYELMKESGVLLNQKQYDALPQKSKAKYRKPHTTGDKSPINDMFAGHYYNEKWQHYIEGSRGFNLGVKKTSKIVGKDLAPFATGIAKLVIGAAAALKGPILVYRASSYVNSVISNMMIYTINSSDPISPRKRYVEAKNSLAEYKELLAKAVDFNKTPEEMAKAKAELHNHKLHSAFQHGIASTIRSDAYTTGSYQENVLITNLKDLSDDNMANAIKTLLADPSTQWGAGIGTVFDNTEVIPKVMMYLADAETYGDKAAIQRILLAYPTYNNLGPILNGIDQISPYTKYLANYPKMMSYAITNNSARLASLNALFFLGVRGTYGDEIESDEMYWKDNNFAKVFGAGYKSWESLNPYWVPSKQMDGFGIIDPMFSISAAQSLTTPSKVLVPFTLSD